MDLVTSIGYAAAYAVAGSAVLCLGYLVRSSRDWPSACSTPGDMASMVVEPDFHPASIVAAAAHLAISLVVVASIA
jgi:hypothetical protein